MILLRIDPLDHAVVLDDSVANAQVTGAGPIRANPRFLAGLPPGGPVFVLGHEAAHIEYGHTTLQRRSRADWGAELEADFAGAAAAARYGVTWPAIRGTLAQVATPWALGTSSHPPGGIRERVAWAGSVIGRYAG